MWPLRLALRTKIHSPHFVRANVTSCHACIADNIRLASSGSRALFSITEESHTRLDNHKLDDHEVYRVRIYGLNVQIREARDHVTMESRKDSRSSVTPGLTNSNLKQKDSSMLAVLPGLQESQSLQPRYNSQGTRLVDTRRSCQTL